MGKLSGIAHQSVRHSSNCEVILAWCLRGLTSLSTVLANPSCVSMERMHDLSYFRANFERIAERLASRGNVTGLDEFRELDALRRKKIRAAEDCRAEANKLAMAFSYHANDPNQSLRDDARVLKGRIAELGKEVEEADARFQELLAGIPNIPHESVPVGKTADDNVEVRRVGEPPRLDFEPQAHWDLGPELGILDFERAAKITGARFALYWDLGAKLERALINFMLDVHTRH